MDSLLSISGFFIFFTGKFWFVFFQSGVVFVAKAKKNVYYQSLPEQSVSKMQPLWKCSPITTSLVQNLVTFIPLY